jgi:hypothetical protein
MTQQIPAIRNETNMRMRAQRQSLLKIRLSICLFSLAVLVLPRPGVAQSQADLKQKLQPFTFMVGQWHCAGHFTSSGKAIEANLNFAPSLEGVWLEFRHDDLPPNIYHALALWAWDNSAGKYVSLIQDNFGGHRAFTSEGWRQDELVWLRDATQDERFIFHKSTDNEFSVAYQRIKEGAWREADVSTCKRTVK